MSHRLERAARALREVEDGRSDHADETLARILEGARVTPKRRAGRSALLLIAAVVAISGVTAARTAVRLVRSWVAREGAVPATAPVRSLRQLPSHVRSDSPWAMGSTGSAGAAPSTASTLTLPGIPLSSTMTPPAQDPSPSRAAWQRAKRAQPADLKSEPPRASPDPVKTAQALETKPSPPRSADDDAYARAHRLHFQLEDPEGALEAWDEYLRDFPTGRFAPEARYNRAIDLLKLRRNAEARAALEPFAAGVYGSYHREAAQELLRSIPAE